MTTPTSVIPTKLVTRQMARTRSYGGCGTCRNRHVKCDESRSTCVRCSSQSLKCEGYTRAIFFDHRGDDDIVRYRQTLFTDTERQDMVTLMTREVPVKTTFSILTQIESHCESGLEPQTTFLRGPFGAFKVASPASAQLDGAPNTSEGTICHASQSTLFDLPENDIFDMPSWIETTSLFEFDKTPLPNSFIFEDTSAASYDEQLPREFCNDYNTSSWLASAANSSLYSSETVLQEAPNLLKHYAEHFIPSLSPFKHTKTPWHVLFLPNVKNTLASIAIGEDVDAANMANFYASLTISALSLQTRCSSAPKWRARALMLRQQAEQHIGLMLIHAFDAPKVFKYKSIVMALLMMVQLTMFEGAWRLTDFYLLETEKIIRLRGLPKRNKSRKVRLLHHCYAYIRIFHESLSMNIARTITQRSLITDAVKSSGSVVQSSDIPSFRLIEWDDLDRRFERMKTREEGENDLHLSTPGTWPDTLYPEIFGIPETFMNLLSQIIRLGNEKDMSDGIAGRPISLKEFTLRSKELEKYILKWNAGNGQEEQQSQAAGIDSMLLRNMQNALHHALIIYFYRRVHDVDPTLLQPEVEKVKSMLYTCKELSEMNGALLNAFMWPAFIAGCEALNADLQNAFSRWFTSSIQYDTQSSSSRLLRVMHRVWNKREKDGNNNASWLILLEDNSA